MGYAWLPRPPDYATTAECMMSTTVRRERNPAIQALCNERIARRKVRFTDEEKSRDSKSMLRECREEVKQFNYRVRKI